MPHADYMPTVVFPNNRKGSEEWGRWDKSDITVPYFCNEFQDDHKKRCQRRNPDGVGQRNLCRRCVAGYLYDFQVATEQTADHLNV